MAVWFCWSRFYLKKGYVVASERTQLVRESDSFIRKRQINVVLTNLVAEHDKSRTNNARTWPLFFRAIVDVDVDRWARWVAILLLYASETKESTNARG